MSGFIIPKRMEDIIQMYETAMSKEYLKDVEYPRPSDLTSYARFTDNVLNEYTSKYSMMENILDFLNKNVPGYQYVPPQDKKSPRMVITRSVTNSWDYSDEFKKTCGKFIENDYYNSIAYFTAVISLHILHMKTDIEKYGLEDPFDYTYVYDVDENYDSIYGEDVPMDDNTLI